MKRTSIKRKDAENRLTLDSVMTEVDTEAADEQAAEQAYAEQLAALDEQAAEQAADIERRKANVDIAADAEKLTLANKAPFVLASDDTHKAKAAPVFDALSNFGQSLDLSAVRAKFSGYGDIIADALTEFVGVSAVENVALPVCRIRALSRIMNDESALKVISAAKTADGKSTYGKTKSPVARFLMDNLNLSKQQTNTYIRVTNACIDKATNDVKPEFRGFTFTQLDILSATKYPVTIAKSVDAALSTKDFKEAVSRIETELATLDANKSAPSGQPDESKPSGQPDESKPSGQSDESKPSGQSDAPKADNLTAFVVGNVPANNATNFTPQVKPGTDKPIVIRASNLTAAVSLFCQTDNESHVLFRLPKAAEKGIIDALPAAFNGYAVKAIIGDVSGYFGRANLYAIATVVTVGTDETAETTKAAAKRVETARSVLANWLTGAAELQGIPNAVDVENAMEIFKKAYEMALNIPRMSAQVALADLYKSGEFQIVKHDET